MFGFFRSVDRTIRKLDKMEDELLQLAIDKQDEAIALHEQSDALAAAGNAAEEEAARAHRIATRIAGLIE